MKDNNENPKDLLKNGQVVKVRFKNGNEMVCKVIAYRPYMLDEKLLLYEGYGRCYEISDSTEIIKIVNDNTTFNEDFKRILESSEVIYRKQECYDGLGRVIEKGNKVVVPNIIDGRLNFKEGTIINLDGLNTKNPQILVQYNQIEMGWVEAKNVIKSKN